MFVNFSLLIVLMALLIGCQACFRNDQHGSTSLPTGSAYYEECQCTEPGYSADKLIWLDKDNQPIQWGPGTNPDIYIERQSDSINLHIRKVTKTMSGTYKCVTELDGTKYVQSYTIEAFDPLYFYGTANDQYLVNGTDSIIFCRARGDSDPLIRWQRKDDLNDMYIEINNNEKFHKNSEGLIIKNVTVDDAGTYKCTAQGITTGEELDKYIKVEVQTVPIIKELIATPDAVVDINEYLSIDCVADGTPHPDYIWNKLDANPQNETNTTRHYNVNTLIFENIQPEDRGIYQCTAYNSAGNSTKEIFVEVLVPPEIISFENITAIEGSTIEIICNATGRPQPNVTLTYEGKNFEDLDTEVYKGIPDIIFATVDRTDEGIYLCNASNEVDFVTAAMYLTVLHRPYFEEINETIWAWDGKTVNLSCVHDSNPQSNITWRFDSNELPTAEQVEINKKLLESLNSIPEHYLTININKNYSYGIYFCTAKNQYGGATKMITVKQGFRPSVVTNVTILEVTATSVTFYIQTPDQFEGPSVLGFTALYDEADNYNITDIHLNRTWAVDRPYRIEKLKPHTRYFVSFVAMNEVGTGEWSDNIEFNTLEKSIPESPVVDQESIETSSKDFVLNWKVPEDNGEPIDYYTVRYCPVNKESQPHQSLRIEDSESSEFDSLYEQTSTPCKIKRVSSAEIQLTDLVENTTYFLELIAHNAKGNSNPANLSLTVTAPQNEAQTFILSAGAVIGISIVIVVLLLILLDVLFLVWRRKGIIASVCIKDKKKRNITTLSTRDRKGLLTNGESTDDRQSNNGHKEFQYNKTTGTVTGKHSAV